MSPTLTTVIIAIPAQTITDWDSFHTVFADALGFPAFYGRNLNAWIDCLSSADDPDAGMIATPVPPGSLLTLRLDNAEDFQRLCPEQHAALIDSAAFVNTRRVEAGEPPVLALLLVG